jgi:hypothetical protein
VPTHALLKDGPIDMHYEGIARVIDHFHWPSRLQGDLAMPMAMMKIGVMRMGVSQGFAAVPV